MYLPKQQKEVSSRTIENSKKNDSTLCLQRSPKGSAVRQYSPWTKEEEVLLLKKVKELGQNWNIIARFFKRRNANDVKNKYSVMESNRKDDFLGYEEDFHYEDSNRDSEEYDYNGLMVLANWNTFNFMNLLQLRRKANAQSDKKTFTTSCHGEFENVSYTTDSKGGIDFQFPNREYTQWSNPVHQLIVDLSDKQVDFKWPPTLDYRDFGMLQSGKFVEIKKASRAQHFNIANRLIGIPGSSSPNNWTWHHLLEYPKMVLVDRTVHSKYGHNGGFLLWNE